MNVINTKSLKKRNLKFKDGRNRFFEIVATTILTCMGNGIPDFSAVNFSPCRMFQSDPKK
jgi:hypothetical protein